MASIYLVRHGQASFGKADYDQLSEKGIKQSRLLGEHWRSLDAPDKYYTGDLLRHGQTHEHFIAGYQGELKPLIIGSGFNEFNHVDLLSCYDPQWGDFAKRSQSIAKLSEPNKFFQSEFSKAMARWTCGANDNEYKESWPQFKRRCVDALLSLIEHELALKEANKSEDIFIPYWNL
jgi:broad specificity phosphatase PhoE